MQRIPGSLGGSWQRPDHDVPACAEVHKQVVADRAEPAANAIALDGVTDGLRDDDAEPRRLVILAIPEVDNSVGCRHAESLAHGRSKVIGPSDTILPGEHREVLRGKFGATLATASAKDGAAGAGAHAQTESVHLGAAAVVRLKSSLAHNWYLQSPALKAGKKWWPSRPEVN